MPGPQPSVPRAKLPEKLLVDCNQDGRHSNTHGTPKGPRISVVIR